MSRVPIDVGRLRAALADRWARIDAVAGAPSTNSELLERRGAADRTLLVAEFQSAGRGRYDRAWTSPPGAGITASFLFRPQAPLSRWGWLPLLAGVAVTEAVRDVAGLVAVLKWPNDVLLGGAKLAGILAQSAEGAVVIGIGCNVSTTADELPAGIAATSLALAGATVDRAELLVAMATRLDARVAQWDDYGGDAAASGLAAAYHEACDTVGREVAVAVTDNTTITGTAHGVDESGHLIVHAGVGCHLVAAGDVQHLRAAPDTR